MVRFDIFIRAKKNIQEKLQYNNDKGQCYCTLASKAPYLVLLETIN